MSLTSGARLGPYTVLSAIGVGGMGEVYRARDTRLNRDVAIKILPELFAADADRVARFQREAQLLASLNHPNIAQIYGVEERPADHLRQGYGGQEAGHYVQGEAGHYGLLVSVAALLVAIIALALAVLR